MLIPRLICGYLTVKLKSKSITKNENEINRLIKEMEDDYIDENEI